MSSIPEEVLRDLYMKQGFSSAKIAEGFDCSIGKINYWLIRYGIQKRSISEAIYKLKNPSGDPFSFRPPQATEEVVLFGLGLGLYWGEGAKRGNGGVRLTNTDPSLVRTFIKFLEKFFAVPKYKLKFSIQIFNDLSEDIALNFWTKQLGVKRNQFYKTIVSEVRGNGTYKHKSEYGVIILYFNNIKFKRLICSLIDKI